MDLHWTTFSCLLITIHLFTNVPVAGLGLPNFKSRMISPRSQLAGGSRNSPNDDPNSYAYWNCHTIPPNMTLCKSVGYSRMVLPNFLQHESLREVIQQANIWVALVNTDCHPDIQRFLCSLYAPVCLKSHQEAKIPPCWELCDQVRNACLPRMRLFGFDWPDIVRCTQFPRQAESMCIPPHEDKTVTCVPCEQAITLENIASSYCMADVVLKATLKSVVPEKDRASVRISLKKRTIALKLLRNDGSLFADWSLERSRRRRRHRHRSLQARRYRHALATPQNYTHQLSPSVWSALVSQPMLRRGLRQTLLAHELNAAAPQTVYRNEPQRRKRRSPRFYDLDGISELVLDCSSCSRLRPFIGGPEDSRLLVGQKWLIMGRRIKDEKTNVFTNQLQVTFLTVWDRDSPEFRRALSTVRRVPVSSMCSEQTSKVIRTSPQPSAGRPAVADHRNMKILRSVALQPTGPRNTNNLRIPTPYLRQPPGYPQAMYGMPSRALGPVHSPVAERSSLFGSGVYTAGGRSNATRSNSQNTNSTQVAVENSASPKVSDSNHVVTPVYQHNNWPAANSKENKRLPPGNGQFPSWYDVNQTKRYLNRQRRRRERQARRRLQRQRTNMDSTNNAVVQTPKKSPQLPDVKPINPYQNEEPPNEYLGRRCCTEVWCGNIC